MKYSKYILPVTLIAILVLVGLLGGCTKKLDGETSENLKPLVWFVNVPPDGDLSSVNPIINWVGQDRDGLIDFYRYFVVSQADVVSALGLTPGTTPTGTDLGSYIGSVLPTMPDTVWTVLDVTVSEPQTSNIIPLKADLGDPINSIVSQYLFVQAFDEEGLGSDIIYRLFNRNDNPPNSRIVGFIEGAPFINSVVPTFAATGVRMRWTGSDIADFPTDPPPFEFEWKLFGPYTDSMVTEIRNKFMKQVYVTTDAQIYQFGTGDSTCWVDTLVDTTVAPPDTTFIDRCIIGDFFVTCDTTFAGGNEVESCDTIVIDTIIASGIYGKIDTLIQVFDSAFINDPIFYKVADSSLDVPGDGDVWVTDTRDSMFNVYRNTPSDTTQMLNFLFVVRSRDDALVPDLTPSFRFLTVIDPKFERDILVIQMSLNSQNHVLPAEASNYWQEAIEAWGATRSETIVYDPAIDYRLASSIQQSPDLLRILLSHKIIIPTSDVEKSVIWSVAGGITNLPQNVYVALQTGMSAWLAMRIPIGSVVFGTAGATVTASPQMTFFFGVEKYTYSGWGFYYLFDGQKRVEHFKGTLSLDTTRWPELTIDTARLHNQYRWGAGGWIDSIGSLPEVGWMERNVQTEVFYLYKSLYGQNHYLGAELSFHGRPVAHRLNRGIFRTQMTLFSPQPFEQTEGQAFVNRTLDWLYAPFASAGASREVTNNVASVSSSELGRVYWECYWAADGDLETFYNLLDQSYYR